MNYSISGYDGHLMMQAVRNCHGRIKVIPNSFERYQSLSIGQFKFLDSFQFMSCSLSGLSKQMKPDNFAITARFFPDPTERALMLRKAAYPYDYMQ